MLSDRYATGLLSVFLFIPQSPALAQEAGASKPKPQQTLKRADSQYKRIHQFVLRMIEQKKHDVALETLDSYLEKHPEDAESFFMLGVLSASQNKVDAAIAGFKLAVENGLSPGRIVCGPRDVMRSVQDTPYLETLRAQYQHIPVHGPLLGHVTETQASVWIRTATESTGRLIVSEQADMSSPTKSAEFKSQEADDFTCVLKVSGLKPETRYFYQVELNGQVPDARPDNQYFRTCGDRKKPSKFTLAFGGGAGYVPPNERQWNTIDSFKPDLMLLLGDNVYIDDPESPAMQKYTYYRRQSRPEYRNVTAHTAVYTIWDDHDFSTNDSWGGPQIAKPDWKKNSVFPIYRQNWANPGYAGGDNQPGCWYSFRVGEVDFVMLDCRYYRTSPKLKKEKSMLGPAQKKWLRDTLKTLDGKFKVICSSVPWEFRTKGDSLDTWNGFKKERAEVFSYIEDAKLTGVILMSADRHRSDAWKIERPGNYPFYEFNSSRLTNQHVHKEMAEAIFSYNKKQSFGLVTFDTTPADPTVTYKVINIDGEQVHDLTVKLSSLQ